MTERSQGSKGRRLLAVDDNRLILRVISDYFVPQGWGVVTAEHVPAARLALERDVPDAIVSDILMPEIDGWAFFDGVRAQPATASVPFIFLTVEGELPQRLRGLHLGADDYMTKPFAVEELYVRIERLVDRREALETARRGGEALLAGSVEHLAISDLLQILSLNGKDGTVVLEEADRDGRIEFVAGQIVHAEAGSARGTKALFRMLGWTSAAFRVMPRAGAPHEATITGGTANVLMDGLVSLDEWGRWKELLPSSDAMLMLATDARGRLHGHSVTPAEFDVLARAKTGIRVDRAIEDSPHPDSQVAEAICTLMTRGIVAALAKGSGSSAVSSR
jgi:DNA-binding response OmpR family regulator